MPEAKDAPEGLSTASDFKLKHYPFRPSAGLSSARSGNRRRPLSRAAKPAGPIQTFELWQTGN